MPASDHRGLGSHVLELSEEMSSGLDIFEGVPKDTSILGGKTVIHHLSTAINDDTTVFEFIVPSENLDYTYLPLTRLEGELKITKNDNTAIAQADDVGPVNLLSGALWRQVECELNGVQVGDLTSPTYHYKAFLETHLSYGTEAKKGHLRCALYEPDTTGQENSRAAVNAGFTARKAWITGNNGSIYFSTPVFIDFLDSHRYLIPGSTLKLRFLKNENSMCFMAGQNNYKIAIRSLNLSTRKLTIHPDIVSRHQQIIQTRPAIYPIAQSRIKTHGLAQGTLSTTLSGIFMGKLPRSCVIGFVASSAFAGGIADNPFVFAPYDVSYVSLTVNGLPMPTTVFQPDFDSYNCVREYRHFMDNLGIGHENIGNNISFADYVSNTAMFSYDFTPDLCNSYHDHPDSSGAVNLDLRFKTALPHNVTVIIYATYNQQVKIDHAGNVTLEQ